MANFPPRAPYGNQPTNQPASQPGSGAVAPTGAVGGMRTAGVRPCPNCSTLVNVHATVCPNCGEQIGAKEKTIRCRRCRHRASSDLVVCPHCGRELQSATSRWLTWGLPLLAVLLLSGVPVLHAGHGDPSSWAQAQVGRVVRLVQALGSRLQPDVTISMIPAGQDPNDPLVSQAAQAGTSLNAASPSEVEVVDVASTSANSALALAGATAGATPGEPGSAPPPDAAVASPTAVAAAIPAEPATSVPQAATPVPPTATPVPPTATPVPPTATPAPPTATAELTAEATATATTTQEPTSTATATSVATATGTAIATQAPTQAATPGAALAAARTLTRTTAARRGHQHAYPYSARLSPVRPHQPSRKPAR